MAFVTCYGVASAQSSFGREGVENFAERGEAVGFSD